MLLEVWLLPSDATRHSSAAFGLTRSPTPEHDWLGTGRRRHEHCPTPLPSTIRHMGLGHCVQGTLPYDGWRYESTYRQLTSLLSMVHSWCEAHDVMPTGNTLHEHSFVSVSHPNRVMELAAGHAPQITLLKSLCWMHVSAAVHARELTPGSAPTQQRVGMGRVCGGSSVVLDVNVQVHRVFLVQGTLASMASTAAAMSVYR